MSPPTEQLIRDYLNRLSVAARGRLSAEDRRALVTRTHDFIDRNASPSGPPTSMEIATFLHRLGDPVALVDQEVARLAEERGDTAAAPSDTHEKGAGVLRRLSAHSSWHWPSAPGSPHLRSQLLNGHSQEADLGVDSEETAGPARAGESGPKPARKVWLPPQPGPADAPVPSPNGKPDATAAADVRPDRSAWPPPAALGAPRAEPAAERDPGSARAAGAEPAGAPGAPSAPGKASPSGSASGPGSASASGKASASGSAAPWKPRNPVVVVLTARASALGRRLFAWARRSPVEAAAVTLLGLGGAAYPPIWLLGAVFTLASHAWDYRDKWVGLAIPVLVLVVGTAFGVTFGGTYTTFGRYVHEGWVYADVLSRVGALLGTGYLVWRLRHTRRAPTVPPWNKPHRVD
jgi:hypothetical protein